MQNTKELIQKYGIRPTKSLGQNFLADNNIIEKIADAACIKRTDLVIEVGPGIGSMTRELAARAGKVIAIEIDRHLMDALNAGLAQFENVEIINQDILKANLKEFFQNCDDDVKVVANLPYYITSAVIMKFLEEASEVSTMVFMVQKEVAERIVAKPGGKEYGVLSALVQYHSDAEIMFTVSPHCFIPQPGVDSAVIRLNKKAINIDQEKRKKFYRVVKAAFGQRRKNIVNSLYNSGQFQKSKVEIAEVLLGLGIKENQRAEELSITQFERMADFLL